MSNFQCARNRILYSQNKYITYTISEHTERIKRVGNPRGSYEKNEKIKEEIRARHDPDHSPKAHDILKGILILYQYPHDNLDQISLKHSIIWSTILFVNTSIQVILYKKFCELFFI